MTDIRKDLQDLIADIRSHVEFQRALGIKTLEVPSAAEPPVTVKQPTSQPPAAPPARPDARPAVPAAVEMKSGEAVLRVPASLEAVREELGDCKRCKLQKDRNTIVFGEGNASAELVFVGEGPGFEEDQQGRPFVGAAGQLLTDIIVKGMKLKREEVYICNIVKCRPPGNRNPEPDEVEACIDFVKQQIAVIKPRVIVTLGNVPTQSLLHTKLGITKLRGTWQEYNGIPVMPTFHPSYLLRSPGEKGKAWDDIKKVMAKLGMDIPEKK